MNLTHILIFAALALVFGVVASVDTRLRALAVRARGWLMLVVSVLALFWLQSSSPVRNMDFWLPLASLGLTLMVWFAINAPKLGDRRDMLITLGVLGGMVALIALLRYIPALCCITPSRPPDIITVVIAGAVIAAAVGAAWLLNRRGAATPLNVGVLLLIVLFVVLKFDPLALSASAGLRALQGQDAAQASALDLRWLGFSYIAFRLMHVLRDRATGRLAAGALSLREFVSYVVFFPALTAGPIDRAERFVKDYRNTAAPQTADVTEGARRMVVGVFKKFVLADLLAIIALNGVNAGQASGAGWMWVLVYAYALRIYFDFGGYTDVAIGLGRCFGIKLPENFERPYLKPNLTMFWNSWHITLAQWFRAYFFNPFTRSLRTRKVAGRSLTPAVIILSGQVCTMLLIGLWHGITWNFVAWGAWHAAGLFIHNRWAEFNRKRQSEDAPPPSLMRQRAVTVLSVLATFHFVALGWVWFALPSISVSLDVFRKLLGVAG